MDPAKVAVTAFDDTDRALFRVGGGSGIVVALLYPVIITLYVFAGTTQPVGEGGEAWLDYLSGKTGIWWAIVGLSVLTDLLWVPVAWALYRALKAVSRNAIMVGTGLLVLFVVLELAVSWTNYAVLIELTEKLAAGEAQRAAVVAAADYASAAQSSSLLPYYAILIPALGQLVIGAVMLEGGPFGRTTAYLAVLVGLLGIVAVLGPYLWPPLDRVIIPASLLSGVWFFLVGYRLVRLGASAPVPETERTVHPPGGG